MAGSLRAVLPHKEAVTDILPCSIPIPWELASEAQDVPGPGGSRVSEAFEEGIVFTCLSLLLPHPTFLFLSVLTNRSHHL